MRHGTVGKRRLAREMAVRMLYQLDLGGMRLPQVFAHFDLADFLGEAGRGGRAKAAKDGSAVEVDVIFTDTVVRQRGGWKFAAGHVSRVPPRR